VEELLPAATYCESESYIIVMLKMRNPHTFLLHRSELKILGSPLPVQVLHPPRASYIKPSSGRKYRQYINIIIKRALIFKRDKQKF